jgi:hypothetical protein
MVFRAIAGNGTTMGTPSTIRRLPTDGILWTGVLLTLIFVVFSTRARADDNTAMIPMPLISERPSNSALANEARNQRMAALLDYVRSQGPALMPGLSDTLRGPTNFVMRQIHSAKDGFGLANDNGPSDDSFFSFLSPVFSFMHPSDESVAEALWLSPGYHHAHGMLPFNDAVLLGFNYRNTMFGDHARLSVHPFYAQSWHSTDSYWGVETALALGPSSGKSWGTIGIRYTNGDTNMLDHGRHGIDMHADLAFNDNLNLTAGAQTSEDADVGNYVMLKWKMEFGK